MAGTQNGDDDRRIATQRVLIAVTIVLGAIAFFSPTPVNPPAYALDSDLVLRIERAAVPVALFLGLGGLAVRLWFGDKVATSSLPGGAGLGAEDATKPTEALKEGVDQDIRALSDRLLRVEKIVETKAASAPQQEYADQPRNRETTDHGTGLDQDPGRPPPDA